MVRDIDLPNSQARPFCEDIAILESPGFAVRARTRGVRRHRACRVAARGRHVGCRRLHTRPEPSPRLSPPAARPTACARPPRLSRYSLRCVMEHVFWLPRPVAIRNHHLHTRLDARPFPGRIPPLHRGCIGQWWACPRPPQLLSYSQSCTHSGVGFCGGDTY